MTTYCLENETVERDEQRYVQVSTYLICTAQTLGSRQTKISMKTGRDQHIKEAALSVFSPPLQLMTHAGGINVQNDTPYTASSNAEMASIIESKLVPLTVMRSSGMANQSLSKRSITVVSLQGGSHRLSRYARDFISQLPGWPSVFECLHGCLYQFPSVDANQRGSSSGSPKTRTGTLRDLNPRVRRLHTGCRLLP